MTIKGGTNAGGGGGSERVRTQTVKAKTALESEILS